MSFTKNTAALAGLALLLGGCVQAQGHMQADYGQAVRQDIAAQVADPEARYARQTPPAASGGRAVLAQQRYLKGQVTPAASDGTGAIQASSAPTGAAPPAGRN